MALAVSNSYNLCVQCKHSLQGEAKINKRNHPQINQSLGLQVGLGSDETGNQNGGQRAGHV